MSLIFINNCFSQDSLFVEIALEHLKKFNLKNGKFNEEGWDFRVAIKEIMEVAPSNAESNNVVKLESK